jgi:ribonuclease HI
MKAILYCDGGARGNPGPAAAGAVLFTTSENRDVGEETESSPPISRRGWYLGRATNNEAEYEGLIRGLEMALAQGVRSIEVRMDSELVVKQVNGEYKVKKPHLQRLHNRAVELLDSFEDWRIIAVPRDCNSQADAIVNEILDNMKKKA